MDWNEVWVRPEIIKLWAYQVHELGWPLCMLSVKGIVGSYTPLVAHISVWETSGISGILDGDPTGRGQREVKNIFLFG